MGLVVLDDAPARARHDVDTVDDLRAAQALGVGPQTAAALLAVDGPVGEVAY
jgi:2-phospho-L-lactate guanylyltransferase